MRKHSKTKINVVPIMIRVLGTVSNYLMNNLEVTIAEEIKVKKFTA